VEWCLRDIAANRAWAAQGARSVWTGNAGDAASAHLFRMSKALDGAASTLDELGTMYRAAAQSAFELADIIGSLLSSIADAAIGAAAAGAVAGGSASTGVGLPLAALAGLVGAVEVGRVVSGVIEIIDYVGKFDSLASTLKSSLGKFGRIEGDFHVPELPTVPALPH
jgi:hypothetical protein